MKSWRRFPDGFIYNTRDTGKGESMRSIKLEVLLSVCIAALGSTLLLRSSLPRLDTGSQELDTQEDHQK